MKNINFELKYIYMLVNFDINMCIFVILFIYFYIYIIKMDLIVINVL